MRGVGVPACRPASVPEWARRGLPAILVLLAVARALPAQAPERAERERAPAVVSWGKWGATALFVGLTAVGISRHDDADRDYDALVRWCQTAGSCLLGLDGNYADPRSESLYQSSIAGDRAARRWLVAGQAALAGAVALFIVQLSYEHGPENIPFEPRLEVAPGMAGVRVGLGMRW